LPLPWPQMQKQKSGHTINGRFRFGIKVFAPRRDGYSATKSAVRALTEGLRWSPYIPKTSAASMISPGAVATEDPESSSEEATRENLREFYKMAIPANSIASGDPLTPSSNRPRWKSTRSSSGPAQDL